MKKLSKILIPIIVVVAVIAGIIGYVLNKLSQDGVLNMNDVYSTIRTAAVYFIPVGILLVIIIALLIIFRNKSKTFKFWLKWESLIVMLLAIGVAVNVVIFQPMAVLFNLRYASMGELSAETKKDHNELTQAIAKEGAVLLKNTDNYLPLGTDTNKLNVFGWASTQPVYGGTGSGNVDTSNAEDILKSLEDAGYDLNQELTDFYVDYADTRPVVGMWAQDWTLPEPSVSAYSDTLVNEAKDFSDTALVVIGRVGGEGADLPTDMNAEGITYEGNEGDFAEGDHFLQLTKSEREMIDFVAENFENVVVFINSANAMELGWLEEYDNIKGALWMAGPGATGFTALGEILNGTVNPSGRLVDTYVYDLKETPVWNNFGHFAYDGDEYTFVNYSEDIYVGYKFYETYYQGNEEDYQQAVQYPFGYGLSYTTFEQKMSDLTISGKEVSFDVTVTNTGDTAGKEVVQVYFTPPYTNGGIEKASTNLLDFGKTKELAPGQSETLSFTLNQEDLAAYDTADSAAYILEKGNYQIQIQSNSHEVIDAKNYEIASNIVYLDDNKRSTDEVAAINQFADHTEGNVVYLSRENDFENYQQATAAPVDFTLPEAAKDGLTNDSNYKLENNADDEMPTTGAKNKVQAKDMIGLDYDDPKWEDLLDQLTVSEMSNLITYGGYQTIGISSINKLQTYDFDGPAGWSSFFTGIAGTAFPTATLLAATWNADLAEQRGIAMGQEASEFGLSGWYGPAMNIHRSAFAGRNFEYYSEDGVLSGVMAANEIAGANSKGVYSYMKHFALNDQETNRTDLLLTWSTEQAIREIYLKPFEMAVKDGGATAAMSSFNYIGNQWAGGSSELLINVLRGEWGFNGMVLTDYFGGYGYMDADKAIRNGNDAMLSTTGDSGAALDDTESATAVKAMRTASHNILYTTVNSRAYTDYDGGSILLPWQKTVVKIDIALIAVLVLLQAAVILLFVKRVKK